MRFYSYNKKKHLGEPLTGDSHAAAVMSIGRVPGQTAVTVTDKPGNTRDTHETRQTAQVSLLLQSSPLKDSVLGAQQAAAQLMPTCGPGRTNAGPYSLMRGGGPRGSLTAELPPP